MVDSCDDPCDDVVGENLTGWLKRDSSRSVPENSGQQLERRNRSGYYNTRTRYEHG